METIKHNFHNDIVLVTGGTGAMGSVLVKRLVGQGRRVRVLTLDGDPLVNRLSDTDAEIWYGDISNPDAIKGICDGVSMVFHCAAVIIAKETSVYDRVNVEGTRNIVSEAKRSDVKHFVHISSASVLYNKPTDYSISKKRAEEIVIASSVPYTIIRPTLVYGIEGGLEFDLFLAYLNRYPIIPFIGNGSAVKRPVYVEDIIDGFMLLSQKETGTGMVLNFSGAESITMYDFAKLCLILSAKETKKFVFLPVWFCILVSKIFKKFMKNPPLTWSVIAGVTQNANLEPELAMQEIGYKPSGISSTLQLCFPRRVK